MTDRERICRPVDLLPEDDLATVERMLRGILTTNADPLLASRTRKSSGARARRRHERHETQDRLAACGGQRLRRPAGYGSLLPALLRPGNEAGAANEYEPAADKHGCRPGVAQRLVLPGSFR